MGSPAVSEIWRTIEGYEDYEVSSLGRIKSLKRDVPLIMADRRNSKGYAVATLSMNGKSKTMSVHSLVARAFIGDRPEGMDINHKNGVKNDNRVCNLEYCTSSHNQTHRYRVLGHQPNIGERSGLAKLASPDVRRIRRFRAMGFRCRTIARVFGISKSHVSNLTRPAGGSWKSVPLCPITQRRTSCFKGVCLNKKSGKWQASITVNKKAHYLGLFTCQTAAHIAYCKAAKKHFGEYARTD